MLAALRKSALISTLVAFFRGAVRRQEFGLILLGLLTGYIAGFFMWVIFILAALCHHWFYGIDLEHHLSSTTRLTSPLHALIPLGGGLCVGFLAYAIKLFRPKRPIDPIEANALHGGRMSAIDSGLIAIQTILSNGTGASVGLEAAYTQVGSGLASLVGQVFGMRRPDLRTLVACGSAGAIAAAFGAPLTGTFYAFELILGSYTPFGLAPVGAAAVAGTITGHALGINADLVKLIPNTSLSHSDLILAILLGIGCALFGIGIMRGVSVTEELFKKSRINPLFQPAVGGLIIGALALITPHVLASGHGALADLFFDDKTSLWFLLGALFLKALASSISIGSGFRGGLFFASLYLGGLAGHIAIQVLALYDPGWMANITSATVVGMAAMATTIVGGPLTMSFLALETTGDVPLGVEMLAVSAVVSVLVRRMFGYSFATWRLHLRGESIRSAQDIGWMRELTVERLMRADVTLVKSSFTIARFCKHFPLGSAQWVIAVDEQNFYKGMIAVVDAHLQHDAAEPERSIEALLRQKEIVLLPSDNAKTAMQIFERSEAEALAVVASETDRRVLGLLSEAHVLRRYTEELDKARAALSGEAWLA